MTNQCFRLLELINICLWKYPNFRCPRFRIIHFLNYSYLDLQIWNQLKQDSNISNFLSVPKIIKFQGKFNHGKFNYW